jgi:GNAT superfamily N-acetyltransferase
VTRYAPAESLTKDHDRSSFDCGAEAQTSWLRRYALLAQQADTARVYVVRPHGELRVAGYYALAAGSIEPDLGSPRLAAGAGRHPIPIVILARLGVDRRDQGQGLGRQLVRDAFMQTAAVAERIGARALLIHAETSEAAGFYRRLDPAFETSTADPLVLILLLKDLREAVQRAARKPTSEPDQPNSRQR